MQTSIGHWRQYLQLPGQVYVLCLGTFVNRAGSFVLTFLSLYLTRKIGADVGFATLAMGTAGFGSLAAGLIGGHLADHFGRRVVMIAALAGGAGIAAVFGFLDQRPTILAALFAFNLITDMYRPAAAAMIADLVPPERRPQAFALMYVAINLGFAIAPVVGGFIASYSYLALFLGDAGTTLIYAGIIALFVRETLPARVQPSDAGAGGEAQSIPLRAAVSQIISDGAFMRFVLGMFLVSLVFVQSWSTLPLFMNAHGFAEKEFGRVIAINGMMIVLLQLPITALATRFPRVVILALSALFTGLGFGATHYSVALWHFAITVIVWTIGEMMQAPIIPAVVGELAPVRLRARYMGVINMSFALASGLGSPLGGQVLKRFGPATLWTTTAVLGVLSALIYTSLRSRIEHQPHRENQ